MVGRAMMRLPRGLRIKLTGNAQASLPLSNGASLFFENIFAGDHSTFWQFFHFSMKGVISGSGRGHSYFPGFNLLSNLPRRENVSAGSFYSVAGNPGVGVLISDWSDGQFAPTVDRSEVSLVSDSIAVMARNTAGREYGRKTIAIITFMILLKITPGAMWATLS